MVTGTNGWGHGRGHGLRNLPSLLASRKLVVGARAFVLAACFFTGRACWEFSIALCDEMRWLSNGKDEGFARFLGTKTARASTRAVLPLLLPLDLLDGGLVRHS